MDEKTYEILSKLKLKHAKLIKANDIETPNIRKLKTDRNKGEYSWTLKSVFIDYLFKKYKNLDNLFYLDGDIFFFNNVALVYKDIGNKSIAIAPHRFPKGMKNRVKQTGIFNAGVIYLKRDKIALKALKRWKKQCIKWCYWRLEDGKLGDQMYLDEWPKLYNNLHRFSHKGINLAPWNVGEFKLTKDKAGMRVDNQPLIFFHFHQFIIFKDLSFQESSGYLITQRARDMIYKPYENVVLKVIDNVKKINTDFNEGLDSKEVKSRFKNIILSKILPFYWRVKTRFTS